MGPRFRNFVSFLRSPESRKIIRETSLRSAVFNVWLISTKVLFWSWAINSNRDRYLILSFGERLQIEREGIVKRVPAQVDTPGAGETAPKEQVP